MSRAQDLYDSQTPPRYEDARPVGRCDDCDRVIYPDDPSGRVDGTLLCGECFALEPDDDPDDFILPGQPLVCAACEMGHHHLCGMQTWCSCDCGGPDDAGLPDFDTYD